MADKKPGQRRGKDEAGDDAPYAEARRVDLRTVGKEPRRSRRTPGLRTSMNVDDPEYQEISGTLKSRGRPKFVPARSLAEQLEALPENVGRVSPIEDFPDESAGEQSEPYQATPLLPQKLGLKSTGASGPRSAPRVYASRKSSRPDKEVRFEDGAEELLPSPEIVGSSAAAARQAGKGRQAQEARPKSSDTRKTGTAGAAAAAQSRTGSSRKPRAEEDEPGSGPEGGTRGQEAVEDGDKEAEPSADQDVEESAETEPTVKAARPSTAEEIGAMAKLVRERRAKRDEEKRLQEEEAAKKKAEEKSRREEVRKGKRKASLSKTSSPAREEAGEEEEEDEQEAPAEEEEIVWEADSEDEEMADLVAQQEQAEKLLAQELELAAERSAKRKEKAARKRQAEKEKTRRRLIKKKLAEIEAVRKRAAYLASVREAEEKGEEVVDASEDEEDEDEEELQEEQPAQSVASKKRAASPGGTPGPKKMKRKPATPRTPRTIYKKSKRARTPGTASSPAVAKAKRKRARSPTPSTSSSLMSELSSPMITLADVATSDEAPIPQAVRDAMAKGLKEPVRFSMLTREACRKDMMRDAGTEVKELKLTTSGGLVVKLTAGLSMSDIKLPRPQWQGGFLNYIRTLKESFIPADDAPRKVPRGKVLANQFRKLYEQVMARDQDDDDFTFSVIKRYVAWAMQQFYARKCTVDVSVWNDPEWKNIQTQVLLERPSLGTNSSKDQGKYSGGGYKNQNGFGRFRQVRRRTAPETEEEAAVEEARGDEDQGAVGEEVEAEEVQKPSAAGVGDLTIELSAPEATEIPESNETREATGRTPRDASTVSGGTTSAPDALGTCATPSSSICAPYADPPRTERRRARSKEGEEEEGGREEVQGEGRGEEELYPMATRLIADQWEEVLKEAGLWEEFGDIPDGLRNGFSLGLDDFALDRTLITENHTKDPAHLAFIEQQYGEEMKLGGVSKGYTKEELEAKIGFFKTAPMNVIEQWPGKLRITTDHSYPRGELAQEIRDELEMRKTLDKEEREALPKIVMDPTTTSINAVIDSDEFPCKWGTFSECLLKVADAPEGTQVATFDVDSVFRNIPVKPAQRIL